MQQLQNASDSFVCAGSVLEAVLDVMLMIREQVARDHALHAGVPGRREEAGPATLIHMRALGVLHKRPGATLSELATQLALTLSATSRLVDTLVDKGWVERRIPEGNRRTVSLRLNAAGEKMHGKKRAIAQRRLADYLEKLKPAERRELCRLTQTLSRVMEADQSACKKCRR